MKRKHVAALAAAVVLVGGGATAGWLVVEDRREQAERDERRAERKADRIAKEVAERAAYEACAAGTQPYLQAVQAVDGAVSVGVNLNEYGTLVRAASIAARQMPSVDAQCGTDVVDHLDAAMVEYAAVGTQWNDCVFSDDDCDVDALDFSPQWQSASTTLSLVEMSLLTRELETT
ncbi:hypothetical protein HMPREF0063_10979 [Aeromicrobium marinum DSM 15272]|uniref:Uncharacterized protein n=1 Tax=Aeromicrobium marinum DSM 15272 TaxID=585531 RepID=E2SAI9_9ACTN|nr:hypothetical protein [Aeromicrobium marinum]EFQ84263.1 hypothetical protein HMPREF0063_10979 [Aeromicrobium marinum DSM 15272]